MAVPLVAVSRRLRSPISPRAGTENSMGPSAACYLHDRPDVLGRYVDDAPFDRLGLLAVQFPIDHFGLADGQFIPFSPHVLDQHGKMEKPPA